MSILSILWSSGKAHTSIHRVHEEILSLVADEREEMHTWMLMGREAARNSDCGQMLHWRLSSRALKGRGIWKLSQWWLQRRLAREIERLNPKVLLLDGIGVARLIIPVVARLHLKSRVIVVFHGQSRMRRSDPKLFDAIAAHRLKLIAVSEALAESLSAKLGRAVFATRTAMNPHSFKQELISRDEARMRLGVDSASVVLGAVGRLVEEKGFLPMLDVLSELSRVRTNIHLVLVGDGEQRPELESRIRRLSLERMVTLAGYRQDAAQLYQAFDVMLIPSHSEGLGLVLQEAVMAHVPVVASDLPVFVEQLGLKGIYVSPNDVSGWVTAIEHVLDSDRRSLAIEQRHQLASEQAWERFRKSYVELLADDPDPISASQNCENGKAF